MSLPLLIATTVKLLQEIRFNLVIGLTYHPFKLVIRSNYSGALNYPFLHICILRSTHTVSPIGKQYRTLTQIPLWKIRKILSFIHFSNISNFFSPFDGHLR